MLGTKAMLGSRYKCDILDDDVVCDDFSRDEEDVGIGIDDDDGGNVLFDDEDLFGEKGAAKKSKNNRSKMLLDELEAEQKERKRANRQLKETFKSVKRTKPDSTRKASKEIFFICRGLK